MSLPELDREPIRQPEQEAAASIVLGEVVASSRRAVGARKVRAEGVDVADGSAPPSVDGLARIPHSRCTGWPAPKSVTSKIFWATEVSGIRREAPLGIARARPPRPLDGSVRGAPHDGQLVTEIEYPQGGLLDSHGLDHAGQLMRVLPHPEP